MSDERSQPDMVMTSRRDLQRFSIQRVALGNALEHALRDLVVAKGPGYLDTFLAKELDALSQMGFGIGFGPGDFTRAQREEIETRAFANTIEDCEAALREAVENVRPKAANG